MNEPIHPIHPAEVDESNPNQPVAVLRLSMEQAAVLMMGLFDLLDIDVSGLSDLEAEMLSEIANSISNMFGSYTERVVW